MYSYLFDSTLKIKPLPKTKRIFQIIRLNSVFGSMVNVSLFQNLTLYLLIFM